MRKGKEMNARQKAKKLKKDNKFLLEIIYKTDELKRLYLAYIQPLEVKTIRMSVKTYAAATTIDPLFGKNAIEFAKQSVIKELNESIKNHVEWKIDEGTMKYTKMLEGRLMIVDRRENE